MMPLVLPDPLNITGFKRGQHAVCDGFYLSDSAGMTHKALLEQVASEPRIPKRLVSLQKMLLEDSLRFSRRIIGQGESALFAEAIENSAEFVGRVVIKFEETCES